MSLQAATGHDHLLTTHELSMKCVYNVILSDKVSALSYYRRHCSWEIGMCHCAHKKSALEFLGNKPA